MEEGATEPQRPNGRINVSVEQLERTLDQKLENAILRLQIELGKIFSTKADLDTLTQIVKDMRRQGQEELDEVRKSIKNQEDQLIALEKDKAGRDAVSNQRKTLIFGGGAALLLQLVSIVLTAFVYSRGHK